MKLKLLFSTRQLKSVLITSLLATTGSHLFAQSGIANYKLTRTTETYTPITGGSVLADTNAVFDDQISPAITIPAFTFGGVSITRVYVHANGFVALDTAASSSNYTPLSSTNTGNKGVIAGFGADLGFNSGNATPGAVSEIRYQQIGDEFVAQFKDVKRWNSTNERISFQIRLNSTTGVIRVVYGGPVVIGSSTSGVYVGIRGNTTSWADNVNNVMIDNVPAGTGCDWTNAVTGNANSSTNYFNAANTSIVPVAGMALVWTPATLAPVRTFSAVTNITATSAKVSWTGVTGATQYNVQYRVPGSCTWTDYSGPTITAPNVTLTGLTPITVYQVRVQSSNGTTTSTWSHIPNAAGSGSGYTTAGTFSTVCTAPTPGATAASAAVNLCTGVPVLFSIANPATGSGLSYQWQSSNDNVTYTNISGATGTSYNANPAAIYYRARVVCSTGPDSVYSTPVQLSFNNTITNTAAATRCGPGTVNLSATSSAGSTVRWYNSLSGGAAIGVGNTFTTPVISATTNYYAGAETTATGNATIGAGATTGSSFDAIFYHLYGGNNAQFLIRASELQNSGIAPGNITSIGINMSAVSGSISYGNLAVSIGSTTNTDMSGGLFTGTLNTVYTNAAFTPVTGSNTFTFTTPFNWDGTSNIVVKFCWSNNNTGGTSNYAMLDNTGFTSCAYYRADNTTAVNMCGATSNTGTTSNRPQFKLNGQVVCSSPRVPVVATVTAPPAFTITANQTICNNAPTTLTVTSPAGNFNNYTWTPATNLFTDVAATIPYTGGSANTVYLKTATAGSLNFTVNALNTTTQCTNIAKDTIVVLPATITATATPAAICNSASSVLSLAPATGYGAGTTQWQSSSNNTTYTDVAANGAGITYTTPVLTATTYYRNVLKSSTGTTCTTTPTDTVRVYVPAITATAPAARCGAGTVTLGATAADGTASWYASATSAAVLGTGATFTTPSLTATTTYYVSSGSPVVNNATIGTGTSLTSSTGYPTAFGNRWYQDWSQMVYTATELHAAGLNAGYISSVSFKIAALGSAAAVSNYTISLGNTSNTTLTGFTTAVTPVYGPATYTSAVGQNTITFTTPYYWDGTSNLILDIRGTGINSINNATTYYTATTGNTVVYAYSGSNNTSYYTSNPTATASTSRLNVIFSNSGCESPRQAITATIITPPVAGITPSGSAAICEGVPTTLTGSGGGNYQWLNAAGILNGQTAATLNTATTDTYRVVVTDQATGCKDTSTSVTVSSHPNPALNLGNDTTYCSGNTLMLNAGNTGATFLWNDFTTGQTKTVTASGNYFVRVTNSFGCISRDTIQVTVNPTPVADLGNDLNLCSGTSHTLDAGNAGASFLWDNGTTSQTRNITATGTYFVKVTNAFNCAASDTLHATFLDAPIINLGNDIEACASTTVVLNAGNQPGLSYLWDNGSTQAARTVSASGTYYVTASNIANCKGSDTVNVTVYANPVVNLGNDTLVCHDIILTLDAQNPGASYLWDNGSTERFRNVGAAGLYRVEVTNAHNCKGSDQITISVTGLPDAAINAVHGDTATYNFNLLNPQHVTTYYWDFGDGSPTATGTHVQHRYAANGQYLVSVLLRGVCNDSAIVARTIEVYELGSGATGIGQAQAAKDLKLYPSPAKDFVVLETSNLDMQHITVYNVVGQKMYDMKPVNGRKQRLDIAAFVSGVYTVRIETTAGIIVKKFEVSK